MIAKHNIKAFILSLFLLLCLAEASGQERQWEVSVRFPIGKSVLDPQFADNAARLNELISYIDSINNDPDLKLTGVTFFGSASPEGKFAFNKNLSKRRRNVIERYVRQRVSIPSRIIKRKDMLVDWSLFAELVEQSDMPNKKEVLKIIRTVPELTYDENGDLIDSRKKHLMDLNCGRAWRYMYNDIFPQIRNAGTVMITYRQKNSGTSGKKIDRNNTRTKVMHEDDILLELIDSRISLLETDTLFPPDSLPHNISRKDSIEDSRKKFYMDIRTNMLYDAAAVPNLGIEFYLGKGWSIEASYMHGWWDSDTKHRFWRIYGADLTVRKYFGRKAQEKPLTGHHLGIYGQAFTYDFEWGGKGYLGGKPGGYLWDGCNYAVGLEYGYSLPVARRLNIDFTIGAGYWGGIYYVYTPADGHYKWTETRQRHWIGPTKAEISLVWLIGHGNANNMKKKKDKKK